jgi:hypothetical protein
MTKRSNKSEVAAILAASKNKDDALVDRKITLATEGFTTNKFCELTLRDRNRLSEENAFTISEYIMAMKREINLRLNTIRTTIQFLSEEVFFKVITVFRFEYSKVTLLQVQLLFLIQNF